MTNDVQLHMCALSFVFFFPPVELISCLEAHWKHVALQIGMELKGKHATCKNHTGNKQNNRTEPETEE